MKLNPSGWLSPERGVILCSTLGTTPLDPRGIHGVVWHWTGGPCLGPGFETALADEISRGTPRASWHFLVAKNGRVLQSVPTTKGAWHVGRPGLVGGQPVKLDTGQNEWRVQSGEMFANINKATIGIELANSGVLTQVGNSFRCDGFPGSPYALPVSRAVHHSGSWFDDFPPAQIKSATELLRAIVDRHKLSPAACSAGHLMYDPTRKLDPGPLWLERYLPQVLEAVFGETRPTPG